MNQPIRNHCSHPYSSYFILRTKSDCGKDDLLRNDLLIIVAGFSIFKGIFIYWSWSQNSAYSLDISWKYISQVFLITFYNRSFYSNGLFDLLMQIIALRWWHGKAPSTLYDCYGCYDFYYARPTYICLWILNIIFLKRQVVLISL